MGTLRTLLAISVVVGHSYQSGMVFVGGRNAVQLFYIISGFLISYVLVENKSYKNPGSFYINRYLRLYPIYFTVAILSLIFTLISHSSFFELYNRAPLSADVLLIFSNIFLFGQDWVMFSGIENGQLAFAADFRQSEVALYEGLIIPQAWTLGVELAFYVVAPFILPRRKLIWTLLVLSLAIRAYLVFKGIALKDPWTYRFFPTELALFLIGALSHQILMPFYIKAAGDKIILLSKLTSMLMVLYLICYSMIPLKEIIKAPIMFTFFIMFLPFAFIFQNQSGLDKRIGELSYPIYIGHMLVIWAVVSFSAKIGNTGTLFISICSVLISILSAMFLNEFIGKRFEKIRQQLKN